MSSKDSGVISIGELIEAIKTNKCFIPLIQRNYKWEAGEPETPGKTSAYKLAKDLKDKCEKEEDYSLGMITLYKNNYNNHLEIIDGQQRLITLSLIFKYIKSKIAIPEELNYEFYFERDKEENGERYSYLFADSTSSKSVDVNRMITNYEAIGKAIENCDYNKLHKFICNNIYILCRYTENEPVDEFLNLNEKKTPFSATDYAKAYALKYTEEKTAKELTSQKFINEFQKLSYYLYNLEKDPNPVFNLIKVGYPIGDFKSKDYYSMFLNNRVDAIFLGDHQDEYTFKENECSNAKQLYDKEYKYLQYCTVVIKSIKEELEAKNEKGNISPNVNIYNSIRLLHLQKPDFKFFDIITNDIVKDNKKFEKVLSEHFSLLEHVYDLSTKSSCKQDNEMNENHIKRDIVKVNAFMETQLYDEIHTYNNDNYGNFDETNRFYKQIYSCSEDIISEFEEFLTDTIQIINEGKRYSKLRKSGVISFKEILEQPEIEKIIIPKIQRDYTLGSNKKYLLELLKDISRKYINEYISEIEDETTGIEEKLLCYYLSNAEMVPYIIPPSINMGKEKYQHYYKGIFDRLKKDMDDKEYGNTDTWKGNPSPKKKALCEEINKLIKLNMIDLDEKRMKLGTIETYDGAVLELNYSKDRCSTFEFSCILGHLSDSNFYIYDGQQRLVTLIFLCAYMVNIDDKYDKKEKIFELLKKFKFEDREKANGILNAICNNQRVYLEDLKNYIEDHTTYSIYKLIETYENYRYSMNDNNIICFSVDYILENIVFQFVTIDKVSDVEQLYMDLNTGAKPLTSEENYKAKLVYKIKTLCNENEYKYNWAQQLDNDWINAFCGQEDPEKIEISIIQWCLKMACVEQLGRSRDFPFVDLTWMDVYKNKIDGIVGRARYAIGNIISRINDKSIEIICENKSSIKICDKDNRFAKINIEIESLESIEEFEFWFNISYENEKLKNGKIEFVCDTKDNPKQIKAYLDKKEALRTFKYIFWISKSNNKEKVEFLLENNYFYNKYNYLESDYDETFSGYFNKDYDKLTSCEQLLMQKLNERRDIREYEEIVKFEEYELKSSVEKKERRLFTIKVKEEIKDKYLGSYDFFKGAHNININLKDTQVIRINYTDKKGFLKTLSENIDIKTLLAKRMQVKDNFKVKFENHPEEINKLIKDKQLDKFAEKFLIYQAQQGNIFLNEKECCIVDGNFWCIVTEENTAKTIKKDKWCILSKKVDGQVDWINDVSQENKVKFETFIYSLETLRGNKELIKKNIKSDGIAKLIYQLSNDLNVDYWSTRGGTKQLTSKQQYEDFYKDYKNIRDKLLNLNKESLPVDCLKNKFLKTLIMYFDKHTPENYNSRREYFTLNEEEKNDKIYLDLQDKSLIS